MGSPTSTSSDHRRSWCTSDRKRSRILISGLICGWALGLGWALSPASALCAAAKPAEPAAGTAPEPAAAKPERPPLPVPVQRNWLPLAQDHEVWLDLKNKQVLVGGYVALDRGALEMFACPQATKEHESVVAVFTPARFVHAGLLALGVKPGTPVQYNPQYEPAKGTVIDVQVIWKDTDGKQQQQPAQQWVKNNKTNKAMEYPWVFVGSGFWKDPSTGEQFYSADAGDFVCVSNFPTAMLDLPVESSQANDDLLYVAFSEHIPPRGTRVVLVLKPQLPAVQKPTKDAAGETTSPAAAPTKTTADEKKPEAQKPEEKK